MIPLYDQNPTRTFPIFTVTLIGANIATFLYQLSLGPQVVQLVESYGMIPYELTHFRDVGPRIGIPVQMTVFTSMFLHGGLLHVAGNMLYLWIFGNNIEDALGHGRFIVFYLVCGILASLTHALVEPNSRIPAIGASGAISGVLGAYLFLYPRARVMTLIVFFYFIRLVPIPAVVVLGFWFLLQVMNSAQSAPGGAGVAYFAHIGGFVAGFILILLVKKPGYRKR
jgi:membrane associated rhomboid family serine protease